MRRRVAFYSFVLFGTLFIAGAVLWIRSWWAVDQLFGLDITANSYFSTVQVLIFYNSSGALGFVNTQSNMLNNGFGIPQPRKWRLESSAGQKWTFASGLGPLLPTKGVSTQGSAPPQTNRVRYATVPWWMIELPLLGIAVFSLRKWRKTPRKREGYCPDCGYDMRATPDRCPECGHQLAGVGAAS